MPPPSLGNSPGRGIVPQTMRSDGFGNAATIISSLASPHNCSRADMPARPIPGKQPSLGSCHAPPLAKNFQQFDREHDVTIFLAFALLDANHHSLAIDVGGLEGNGFRETQAGSVASGQNRAVFVIGTEQKNCKTSSGLRMMVSFLGILGGGMISSMFHSRRSVTL